jgi:hypothetical protein
VPLERHDMIIEYMGETVSSVVADLREREYEKQVGSCYLFRLDNQVCFFFLLHAAALFPPPTRTRIHVYDTRENMDCLFKLVLFLSLFFSLHVRRT